MGYNEFLEELKEYGEACCSFVIITGMTNSEREQREHMRYLKMVEIDGGYDYWQYCHNRTNENYIMIVASGHLEVSADELFVAMYKDTFALLDKNHPEILIKLADKAKDTIRTMMVDDFEHLVSVSEEQLKERMCNGDWMARRDVARRGYGLDVLVNDKSPKVRIVAAKMLNEQHEIKTTTI